VVQGDTAGVWPVQVGELPAALKILEYGTSGQGKVVQDNTDMVTAMLKARGTTSGGSAGRASTLGDAGTGDTSAPKKSSGGCSVSARTRPSETFGFLALAFGALVRRRSGLIPRS